jgi:hypothetical protein
MTLRACVIDTVQVESVPVQAPPHPVNVDPKLGVAVMVTRALAVAKVAVTLRACVIDTVQVESVPVQAPPHPVNVDPKLGVAVMVTRALAAWGAVQVEPQLRPAPVMLPLPTTWPEST